MEGCGVLAIPGRVPPGDGGESAFQSYLDGALETFGIDADESERAVMLGVWSIYEPGMEHAPRRRPGRRRAGDGRGPLRPPARMSALDLPLREQAARIAAGDVDAGELLDACLARIEERNPDLNAIVATFPDESRRMLEEAPEGPLRGVPL